MEKLKEVGYRALAIPFVIALVLLCVLGLAVAPMMHMQPREMPLAIVNLDEGASLPNGEHLVAGDLIEENIQKMIDESSGSDVSPMKFTPLSSREDLDENIADYYGAIVIPADFTEKQMAGSTALATTLGQGVRDLMQSQLQAQQAAPDAAAIAAAQANPAAAAALAQAQEQAQSALAEKMQGIIQGAVAASQDASKPTIELVANTAKSPLFANTMQSSLGTALASKGIDVEITSVGEVPEGANPLSGMLGVQMAVMPLVMLSLIMSLIAFVVTRLLDSERTRATKMRTAGILIAYTSVASLAAASAAYGVVAWFGGAGVPAQAILLLWLASACIMLANLGLLSLSIPLGALIMISVFALGMSTAILPAEMLPTFWTHWVHPWAPQVSIGDAMRNIIYMDGGAFDVGVARLLTWGGVGLLGLLGATFIPSRKKAVQPH